MKTTRLSGFAFVGILVALGASSCCSLKRDLAEYGLGPEAGFIRNAVQVRLILRNISTPSFIEWEVASEQMCTQTSGQIKQESEAFEQTWDVGGTGQRIRFWWSTLSGEADATVLVNDVVVFEGHCVGFGQGKVKMIDTCSYPRVYKRFGSGPYLREPIGRNETDIFFATSKLPPRFGVFNN